MQLVVKAVRKENDNVLSIIFKKPKGLFFYPGQYLDLKVSKEQNRSFSISSSPIERYLMITFNKGVSWYKQLLENVETGDQLQSSHPAGTFTLDKNSPAVFLAGGIGITPFRSMVKYAIDNKLTTPILLIYSNADENFLFKKELDQWQKSYSPLQIIYVDTTLEGRLNKDKLQQLLSPVTTLPPIYYLAGPPKMVNDFKDILLKLNIDRVNIRTDEFTGY